MAGSLFSVCSEIVGKLNVEDKIEEEEEEIEPGQDHVFTFYDSLSKDEKAQLDEQFDDINVEEIEEAFAGALTRNDLVGMGIEIAGPSVMNWGLKRQPALEVGANLTKILDVNEKKISQWRAAGFDLYCKGRGAVVILSGGMDTRLVGGIPKGTLDIGLLSHKSIFQLYIERIRRIQHMVFRTARRAVHIPVYIMCNKQSRYIIEDFFRENDYFGIREQDVMFFAQGYAPILSKQGKFVLAEKHRIAMYPNGNGGVFRGLVEQGMVSDMKSRGVTSLYMCSIDNVLCLVGDPVFVGFCETCKVEAGMKCIEKLFPSEHVGVLVSKTSKKTYDVDGDGVADTVIKVKAGVIEFFEIPDDLKRRRSSMTSGVPRLELCVGNLSQYFFKVDFIKKASPLMTKRWHIIPKAITHVDVKTGQLVGPTEKEHHNAYRLEMFVFDAFEHTKSIVSLEVPRDEFANVKNLTGPDSPQTALQMMGKVHQRWIIEAGGIFQDTRISTEREDAKCEISPLVSYAGEDLFGQFPERIRLPFYLPSQQELLQFSAASSGMTRRPSTHYLDWYSDLAQRELEVELQGNLGPVLEMMEDQTKWEYEGERAEDEEALPPTPRHQEDDLNDRAKGKGKGLKDHLASIGTSAATSAIQTPGEDGGGTPRSLAARAAEKAQRGDRLRDLAQGSPPSSGKPTHQRTVKVESLRENTTATKDGPPPPSAAVAGGSLALPPNKDKKRDAYWKQQDSSPS